MFCHRFFGRTWDFPCLPLFKHDYTTNPLVMSMLLQERGPQVPLFYLSTWERNAPCFLSSWQVTQPDTSWGPGGQLSVDQSHALAAGTAGRLLGSMSRGTAGTSREGIVCLYSALKLHLETASSFGSPNARKTRTNWSELSGGPWSWLGAGVLVLWREDGGAGYVQPGEEMTSGGPHSSPPIPRGMLTRRQTQALPGCALWEDRK